MSRCRRPVAPRKFKRQHDILQRRKASQQLKRLKDEPDALCPQRGAPIFIETAKIDTIE